MGNARARNGRLARWRWRLSGAAMWPAFAAGLAADVLLLHELPLSAGGTSVADALVLAGALSLAIVAVLAPLAGTLVRRRARRDLPRIVAVDYAGTVLLIALTVTLLVAGLIEHPRVAAFRRSFLAQSEAMRAYVSSHQPTVYRRNIARADSVQLGAHLYRTCVPGHDAGQALCAFIDTSRSPPAVRMDSDRAPNSSYFSRRAGEFSDTP